MRLKNLHYGWVSVAVATTILSTYAMVPFTRGVFITPMTTYFGWERGALSAALSIYVLLAGPLAILAGRLCDRYGPRVLITIGGLCAGTGCLLMSQVNELWQVYLVWTLFMAFGDACCMTPVLSTMPRWFSAKRGIALGITTAGFALGGMIWPPIAQTLISTGDWRQAFMVLGVICYLVIVPAAQFMKHSPERMGIQPFGESQSQTNQSALATAGSGLTFSQAIKTKQFWLFGLALIGFFFYFQMVVVHIVPYANDVQITASVAATILSLVSGIGIISRLSMGTISDKIGARLSLTACFFLLAISLGWLLFARETWSLYVFAIIFGLGQGGVMPVQTAVMAELFGLKSLGMISGAIMMFGYSGMAIGPILAGAIFDATGSYNIAFIISAALGVLATILSIILLRSKGGRLTAQKGG